MRNSFIKAMEEFVTPNVILFLGDLGFGVVDKFRQKYPNQLWNAGVAEQNLTGLATGLALSGKKVFTYSIANFNTLRPLEQIRNDIAYHNLNVVIVSVGGGMAYGSLGISHHATEDLAILRAIPNMMVLAPGDTKEAYEITKRLIQDDYGPVYLRLGRAGEATLHKDDISQKLEIGKLLPLVKSDEKKLAIISTGGMLETANKLNGLLHEINVTSSVYSMHTLKPSDKSAIVRIFNDYEKVISLEEHSIIGGLQSAILESLVGVSGIKLEK
ncbi:MAG: transketolase, partial [Candidatus Heimdallarchaeota archaeon]|nr:transketolase [Candidatus Heimdallarchaeota archaeon]